MTSHKERKHSKFPPSGANRWSACSGSVALSEGLPDKDTIWSIEGTRAHEVLETLMLSKISGVPITPFITKEKPLEMLNHGANAARFIFEIFKKHPGSDLLSEIRVYLSFIHPEMFGSFDGAVIDYFGTLHVFDYKYGAGHAVSVKENLQMICYALGLAHRYDWNFKRVRLWVIQPRIRGYDGPTFWEISISELRVYIPFFKAAVKRVETEPTTYKEGAHCHWCKAKAICPLKQKAKLEKARSVFLASPLPKEK